MRNILFALVAALSVALFLPQAGWAASTSLPRFEQVRSGIFRSGEPKTYTVMRELAKQGFRTVIDLREKDEKSLKEDEFFEVVGVTYIARPMSSLSKNPAQDVLETVRLLADPANHPVLVHCQHGRDRTGLVVGLYRVLYEKWSPPQAWAEMLELGYRRVLLPLTWTYTEVTGFKPPFRKSE